MFDLIASGRYTYVVDAINYYTDWYNSTYNNTNLEHIRQLNEALKSNPALITNTTDEAFAYIQQGGYIYPSQEDTYEIYVTQSMCDLYRFSADTPQKSSMFVFLKNSTILKEWNHAIIMNQDFIQRTFNKYYRNGFITGTYPNCTVDPKANLPESMTPLEPEVISVILRYNFVHFRFPTIGSGTQQRTPDTENRYCTGFFSKNFL
uniref:Uncharacterized protein n=1 Tax=Acrobeloides nanus TaxID=290746 RepID=A0A914CQJ2_9BILA